MRRSINAWLPDYFRIGGQVPHPLGRTGHESKGSAISARSLQEASAREAVGRLAQERLVLWLTAPKGVEADDLRGEMDLAPHEAMGPEAIDVEGAPQQGHRARLRAAPNEDHY